MPDYTTVARIYDVLPRLETDVTDLTSAQIVGFIEDAEAEINAMVANLYTVPIAGGPPLLRAVATDMALYRILSRRLFTQERLQNSVWPDRFKEAQDLLKEIASGKTPLVDSGGTLVGNRRDVARVESNTMNYHQTFSELGGLDHFIDPDKIDDLEDERDL